MPLSAAQGKQLQTNINAKQETLTGAATTIASSNLTASKALVSNTSGKVAVSATTAAELGYLSGVTSAVQTQINSKQATITGAATSITGSNLTASKAVVSDGSGKVAASGVSSTELGYLSGVTSSVMHTAQVVNNVTSDSASLPLAAAQGKALQDQITQLNNATVNITPSSPKIWLWFNPDSGYLFIYNSNTLDQWYLRATKNTT